MTEKDLHQIKITNVDVRNVKRISVASVPVESSTLIVGGNNAQGKSSLLDAVAMALGGKKLCPPRPLKDGESSGEVVVRVKGCHPRLEGNNEIKRTFTRGKDGGIKTELVIRDIDSDVDAGEPQTILNAMISASMFDPADFLNQSERKQFNHLRTMLGVNTDELDAARQRAYDERTGVNRKVTEAKVKVRDTYVNPDDIPAEQSLTVTLKQRDEVVEAKAKYVQMRRNLEAAEDERESLKESIVDGNEDVFKLEEQLKAKRKQVAEERKLYDVTKDEIDKLKAAISAVSIDEINEKIAALADEIEEGEKSNQRRQRMLAQQRLHADMQDQLRQNEVASRELTEKIEQIDAEKNELLSSIDWPVDGMEFGDGQILYKGVPLSQASSAEQLRVAVAIELRADRPLPVMIVKNGSYLDDVNLAMLAKLVAEKGGQLFLERVGKGEECHVVLEDGIVEVQS